ncbi:MAG: hypothetical protein OJF55_000222 [Rhodanobacteraceae bacterium]|jgi:hemerythrin-like domain-containing protein|nr:MAG: hypothetical protein OJF55_000222 [Rhodanobacteraceae bacterium]
MLPDGGHAVRSLGVGHFEREHRRLDAQLHRHLLDVAGGDFSRARLRLRRWREALTRHIDIEENRLLPHVPGDARWAARVYRLEHERIAQLADAYAARLDVVAGHPPRSERSRREAILLLLDAVHPLRHLLEHHHQREETALAKELPDALQEAAWDSAPAVPHDFRARAVR